MPTVLGMAALLDDDLADAEDIVGPALSHEAEVKPQRANPSDRKFVLDSEMERLQLKENRKKIKQMMKSLAHQSDYNPPEGAAADDADDGPISVFQNPTLPDELQVQVSTNRSGWLVKQGGGSTIFSRRNWLRRWFVLDDKGLRYQKDDVSPSIDVIAFAEMLGVGQAAAPMGHGFYVETEKRMYFMCCETHEDCLLWIACLRRAKMMNKTSTPSLLF
eukprot:m.196362 g.196362  ORF g.196362 m.196362 type:complete len:218 (-) comp15462_c6_seq1:32-685(-)